MNPALVLLHPLFVVALFSYDCKELTGIAALVWSYSGVCARSVGSVPFNIEDRIEYSREVASEPNEYIGSKVRLNIGSCEELDSAGAGVKS